MTALCENDLRAMGVGGGCRAGLAMVKLLAELHASGRYDLGTPYSASDWSLAQLNGQWYIFYHRMTNNTVFSRIACAEKVKAAVDLLNNMGDAVLGTVRGDAIEKSLRILKPRSNVVSLVGPPDTAFARARGMNFSSPRSADPKVSRC